MEREASLTTHGRTDGDPLEEALGMARAMVADLQQLAASIAARRRGGLTNMADIESVKDMLARIETRLSLLERDKDDATPGPRIELFVSKVVRPIEQSVKGIETAVEKLSEDGRELYDAHKSFLEKESKRKEQEAEERTPLGMVKKYLPVVSLIGGAIMIFRVIGTLLESYIQGVSSK